MLSYMWIAMMLIAVACGIFNHTISQIVIAVTRSAQTAVQLSITLAAMMAFWLGLMAIAQKANLIKVISRAVTPIMSKLFPEVPTGHPAMAAMILNIVANMFGLTNAATPFGIKAMEQLQNLNEHSKVASNAMCLFLAINTSSVQLVPVTAMAYLANAGASQPAEIIFTSFVATFIGTFAAIIAAKILSRLPYYQRKLKEPHYESDAIS